MSSIGAGTVEVRRGDPEMSEVDLSRDPVSVVAGESPIERNAVAMVLAEIEERYQRQWRNGPDAASSARVVLAIDLALDLGSDGFHGRAQGNDVHISTPNPRGLLYGAAHLLDALQDAPLRISDGEWTQTTRSTYRGTDVGGLYDPESSRARSKFEAQFRFLARHRFNFVTLSPTGWKDAIRYRHVAGIEREPD